MENFLTAVHKAKECFEKYNYEAVSKLDQKASKHLCLKERSQVVSLLMSDNLLTSNLITERLNILHERAQNLTNQRRAFLDNYNV